MTTTKPEDETRCPKCDHSKHVEDCWSERCLCYIDPPVTKAGRAGEGLTFAQLQAANVARCVNGFKHTLASWSVAEWTNAMCGEAGEAANVAKKMLRHRDNAAGNRREDTDLAVLRVKLGRELADTVIYACLTAASQGLDLGECVRETFNLKSDELGAKERL